MMLFHDASWRLWHISSLMYISGIFITQRRENERDSSDERWLKHFYNKILFILDTILFILDLDAHNVEFFEAPY